MALFAVVFFKTEESNTDLGNEFENFANEYELMAISVLDDFMKSKSLIHMIMLFENSYFGIDSFDLALLSNSKQFIANKHVQDLLTLIWFGGFKTLGRFYWKLFISISTFGLMAPYLLFGNEQDTKTSMFLNNLVDDEFYSKEIQPTNKKIYEELTNDYIIQSNWNYCHKYKKFITAPCTKFTLNVVWYIIFLTLYSFTLVTQLTFTNPNNYQLVKNVNMTNVQMGLFLVLTIWVVLGFVVEEITQAIGTSKDKYAHFKSYISSFWNILDILGLVIYCIGIVLTFYAVLYNETSVLKGARICLSISLILWYMKLLYFLLITRALGIKVFMIGKMAKDLASYYLIIIIVVIGFGIGAFTNMYPSNSLSFFNSLLLVARISYWTMYGEMGILSFLDGSDSLCQSNSTLCAETEGAVYTFILLVGFMAFSNVLLINILIAMFNSTYNDTEKISDIIWKYQVCIITFDFYSFPVLPPPFNIFGMIFEFCFNKLKTKNNQVAPTNSTISINTAC